jgi:hypothetical protein
MDNIVFANLREKLAGPADKKFHFVVLDSYLGQAVSVGFPYAVTSDADDFFASDAGIVEEIDDVARRLFAAGGLSTDALAADLLKDRPDDCLRELNAWAIRHMSRHGQPLGDRPSRVEQCIAIRAAQLSRTESSYGAFHDELWVAGKENAEVANPEGAIRIDDYFEDQQHLQRGWLSALEIFKAPHQISESDETSVPPAAVDTAAFLVSEYLHLWDGRESKAEFLHRLSRERPGMAVLPLNILGEFRAAAVWFYCGPLDAASNADLKKHIMETSEEVRWLTRLIESAFLESCVKGLVKTLRIANSGHALITCRQAQNALCDLWFATEVHVGSSDKLQSETLTLPARLGQFATFPHDNITITIPFDPLAVDVFGFDTISYRGPLITAKPDRRDRLTRRVAEGFCDEPALIAIQYADQISNEKRRSAISATGHEFANSLSDLTTFSSPQAWRAGELSAETRLNIIHRLAHQLSGAAWVMRALSRSEDKEITDRLPVACGAPPEPDVEFWRTFLFSRLQYATYTSWWTLPKEVRDVAPGIDLEFAFSVDERRWPMERVSINSRFAPADASDPRDFSVPVWPLDASIRTEEHDKLGEYGRIALMLWGGVELMRNATRATVRKVRTDALRGGHASRDSALHTIRASTAFERDGDGRWTLGMTVENPLQNLGDPAPGPHTFHSLRQIQSLLTSEKCEFTNDSKQRGYAAYTYRLRMY